MKIGKASYSGSTKENFKIKDGDNVYRVLPPMGELADAGKWSVYNRVCWGYKGSDGKNKPFISPRVQNYQTKMIEVDCAAFNRAMKLKDDYANLLKAADEIKKSGQPLTDEMKAELEASKELSRTFNIESKFFLNVMTLEGKIGLLKLALTGHKLLKSLGQKLEGEGVDMTGVEAGRFVNINRTGTGLDTSYQVSEFKQNKQVEIDGQMETVQRSMPHKLDDSIIGRLAKEAFELSDLYPTPTEAEVKEIVEAHENLTEEEAAKVVDRILGKKETKPAEAPVAKSEPVQSLPVAEKTAEVAQEIAKEVAPVQESERVTTANSDVVDTNTGEVLAESAAATSNPAAMSDEDFLAGLKV